MHDLLSVVEVAYRAHASDQALADALAASLVPFLDDGFGVGTAIMDPSGDHSVVGFAGGEPENGVDGSVYGRGWSGMAPQLRAQCLEGTPFKAMSRLVGGSEAVANVASLLSPSSPAARDIVALISDSLGGKLLGVGALRRQVLSPKARELRTWSRIAAHWGSAMRLRQRAPSVESHDAIVSPSGRIEHAEGDAKHGAARQALSEAALRSERARGALRHEPEQAMQLWQALVSGRWTIVDHFDSDGRRYLLARENPPNAAGPSELTPRQRAALALRARGHSLKYIGYELGLAEPTVSKELRRAMQHIGVKSDMDLVTLFGIGRQTSSD